MAHFINFQMQKGIECLKEVQQYRQLADIRLEGRYIYTRGQKLLNISTNDYLGLGVDAELQEQFFDYLNDIKMPNMSASSSRLLTGNDEQIQLLEDELQRWYQLGIQEDGQDYVDSNDIGSCSNKIDNRVVNLSALVINSGYHANIGLLPALTALPVNTLILADKLVHASLIDGIRLSQSKFCRYCRYRHNDYEQLTMMIEQAEPDIERIIIVTESVFSMDGDRADLQRLAHIKALDCRIELYVDEAHAVGVLGSHGLGLAEETQTLAKIDYLVGTFGKAFASVGAYVFCHEIAKQWLINHMRPLIFSTALPPLNHAWTRFILAKMPDFNSHRAHVAALSLTLSQAIATTNKNDDGTKPLFAAHYQSPIIPYILGDNARTLAKANQLQAAGFYALPIRPPTVPANTARIRLVMNAALTMDDCQKLIAHL